MSDNQGANMDSVTLRETHFKLGDDKNKYQTSSMEQSEGIENYKMDKSSLDQTAKNELRKSHFVLGNFEPNYNTTFRREYYNKSSSLPKSKVDFFNIERKLNVVLPVVLESFLLLFLLSSSDEIIIFSNISKSLFSMKSLLLL